MATRRALEALDGDIPQPAFDANASEIQAVQKGMARTPAPDLDAALLKLRALEFSIEEWVIDDDGPPTASLLPLLASLGADLKHLARRLGDGVQETEAAASNVVQLHPKTSTLTDMRNVSHTAP